jgi:uncharacterized protein
VRPRRCLASFARLSKSGPIAAVVALILILGACSKTSPEGTNTTTSTTVPPTTATTTNVDGSDADRLPTVPPPSKAPTYPGQSGASAQATFLRQIFNDIQSIWSTDFTEGGVSYTPAKLVIFMSNVSTRCGPESANTGPFYCPADRTVYLDTSFFSAMAIRYGVAGDFAEAYVIAHEMGHHVQNLLGITTRVASVQSADPTAKNTLSVAVELQADCLAGVWAHSTYTRNLLEPGDIEQALNAAQAVGDDFIAHASGATVDPDSWTHGSSAQRPQWFTTGFDDGRADACDTFTGV